MTSKKKPLKDSLLCIILDREILKGSGIISAAGKALRAGADMIQLRDKRSSTKEVIMTALALRRLTKRYGVPLIINDRIDVAVAVNSDGLHIGQADLKAGLVKKIIGKDKLLGVSVADLSEAKRAKKSGADYVGAGPIFKTPIKASRKAIDMKVLKKIRNLHIPIIAIGGIGLNNISGLVRNGFKSVAVIRAVCASQDPLAATMKLREALR